MTRTKLLRSNRSQVVRLPKDVAFPEGVREVIILCEGTHRVIVPANADLPPREQPPAQKRDAL